MDLQFSVYNAQKTWCDHPHCTQKKAWVQEGQWPPRAAEAAWEAWSTQNLQRCWEEGLSLSEGSCGWGPG